MLVKGVCVCVCLKGTIQYPVPVDPGIQLFCGYSVPVCPCAWARVRACARVEMNSLIQLFPGTEVFEI